jgi:hypothetical protein
MPRPLLSHACTISLYSAGGERKYVNLRGSFPTDEAAFKLLISPSKMRACNGRNL